MLDLTIMTALIGTVAAPVPVPLCSPRYATRHIASIAYLPPEVRTDVLKSGSVADAADPFEATDSVTNPDLPRRRFVTGGKSNHRWFVVVEHGGYDRHIDVLGYSELWTNGSSTWHRSATFQGDPCIAINAFLDGVWTPKDGEH